MILSFTFGGLVPQAIWKAAPSVIVSLEVPAPQLIVAQPASAILNSPVAPVDAVVRASVTSLTFADTDDISLSAVASQPSSVPRTYTGWSKAREPVVLVLLAPVPGAAATVVSFALNFTASAGVPKFIVAVVPSLTIHAPLFAATPPRKRAWIGGLPTTK